MVREERLFTVFQEPRNVITRRAELGMGCAHSGPGAVREEGWGSP